MKKEKREGVNLQKYPIVRIGKMIECPYCGFKSDDIDDFDEDTQHHKGVWCLDCDSFIPFGERKQNYRLIQEDKDKKKEDIRKVKIKKQVSPLRYPGGKTKLIDYIYPLVNKKTFVEPYCGGASIGLSLLLAGHIDKLILNDKDKGVYSLFHQILVNTDALIDEIKSTMIDKERFLIAKENIHKNIENLDELKIAVDYLILNRCAFSGIPFAGCKTNVSERWNTNTLISRINAIVALKGQIELYNENALEIIEDTYWEEDVILFIDPPYIEKGNELYIHSYKKEDHYSLAFLLNSLFSGMPGADIIITYDKHKMLNDLYPFVENTIIGTSYTI